MVHSTEGGGAHSSTTPSTHHTENHGHAQSDDAINAEARDSNISGSGEMKTPYTWLAGKMDGWKENDDYREYFERSVGCDGMLGYGSCDGDYDDNGGMATAIGHSHGEFGSNRISHMSSIIIGRL